MAAQLPEKNGLEDVAVIVQLKPALQVQSPVGTLVPVESGGQLVATQLPEKNGLEDVAAIVPLKPASQVQSPAGMLVPVELEGQLGGDSSTWLESKFTLHRDAYPGNFSTVRLLQLRPLC